MSGVATVGVDVGGTTTRVGAVDGSGSIVAMSTSPTPRGADAVNAHLSREIAAVIATSEREIAAVGVGIPGRVDPRTGEVSMAVNVGIGAPTPLGSNLSDSLGLRVAVGNDVDLAALGADTHVRATIGPSASLTYLSIGTGFAVGLVIDGRLHPGRLGAGEIGHVPMPGVTERCSCGQVGCVETVASGAAMMRAWGRPDSDVVALWDAADRGDELAGAVRERALDAVAWTLQCVAFVFDPDTIVIGGGVSALGARLHDSLAITVGARASASRLVASYAILERLVISPADTQFGVIGAARHAARLDAGEVAP